MPTRISGACNGCRAKKQKCSGDKSGCAQCAAAGITCTWPEQRKRGPAKGYIEGLEHRLHEAESLLLHLLPQLSQEQLQAATLNLSVSDYGRGSPDQRSSPPLLNKKTGIEYWESFPLDTVDNIRRWQQDCEVHGKSNPSGTNPTHTRTDSHRSSPGHNTSRPSSTDVSKHQNPHARQSISRHNRIQSLNNSVNTDAVQMRTRALQLLDTDTQPAILNPTLNGWMDNSYNMPSSKQNTNMANSMDFQSFMTESWPQQSNAMDVDIIPAPKADLVTTNSQHHLFW